MFRVLKSRLQVDEPLIARHQTMVWRFLRFLGANPDTADDLGQETFLRLIQSPPEDRGPSATAAWLRTTARHLYLRQGRAARHGLQSLDGAALEAVWLRWSSNDDGTAYHDALRACLDGLGARARQALALRYEDTASRAEIAAALGLADEGVKTLLRRSRAQLLECVEARLRAEEQS